MDLAALKERLGVLTSHLDAQRWRWLGAIAVEQAVGRSVLAKMGRAPGSLRSDADLGEASVALDEWLEEAKSSGLLFTVDPIRALTLSPSATREPVVSVRPELEQLVLRALGTSDELEDVALETQALLGARSVGDLTVLLQRGDAEPFLQRFARRRLPQTEARTSSEWLRLALCEPFDAEWMEATFKSRTMAIATRVLADCLDLPSPTSGLHDWLGARHAAADDSDERRTLGSVLCQHAVLRGGNASWDELTSGLSRETASGYRAAERLLAGDLSGAQQCLDRAIGADAPKGRSSGKKPSLPRCGAVTPIVALLLCARDTEASMAMAKRLLSVGSTDAERGAARAFRILLKYLSQAEAHHQRLHFHQLAAGCGAWEILFTALTVNLHFDQAPTRASWAQHLTRIALGFRESGYEWLALQSLRLAHELSAEYCEKELLNQGLDSDALRTPAKLLLLWQLVAKKPEWKKTLEALADVSETVSDGSETSYRVAWYMDMSDGSFNRPALQEYRAAAGGFSQGQRLTLAELYEHRQSLPKEDADILACTRESAPGRRDPTPEAHEMLIGHPRVFNGMRAQSQVEVVRGVCRVETEDQAGYIRVLVEPEGARLGVNVVPASDTRLVIYRVTKAMQKVIEILPRGVRIPKAHESEVLRILEKLAQTVEVRSPQLGVEKTIEPDSTPCLRIAPHAGAWLVEAGVRPFGIKGRFFVAGEGRPSITFSSDGQRLRCERDLALEQSRVDELVASCPSLGPDPDDDEASGTKWSAEEVAHHWVLGEESVLALLSELGRTNVAHELEWPESTALRLRGTVTTKSLNGRLRSLKGWYIATGGVRLDDVTEIALSELSMAPSISGGRFVRLANGDYLEVEKKIRGVIAALSAVSAPRRVAGASKSDELNIHPAAVSALSELAQPDSGFEVDQATVDWLARVADLSSKTFPIPASLRAELRPYQVEGYRWLCRLSELGLGACLADDMGLGKTLQILAFLSTRTEGGPALVVAPTSVCTNWAREIARFAPALTPVEYMGKDRGEVLAAVHDGPGKVLITSYALLQQDAALLEKVEWGTAVLDEAQFIKNAESLRAKAAFRISAKRRIAATGTPVENHFGDLWSLFQFLNPGLLGDWPAFNRRFVRPIERDGNTAPQEVLRQMIKPYVLRRLKRDVLKELPPLTELQHDVHFSESDALRYALLRKQIHDKLYTAQGKRQNKIEVLAEIGRLRRFCCHPRLVFPDAASESAKIRAFIELVEELSENQHRALVFSQYVDFLSLVREELDERGVTYEYLDGSTPRAARQARVDAFQNGSASLFLISLKAGGFGLNLTAADYVIHLDPWWNPAVEAQATDRAHRIGQERRVTVYRLVTKNSIEEQIIALHKKKRSLARSLLEGGDEAGTISTDELVKLIEGGATIESSAG